MRVLVTGAAGFLGAAVVARAPAGVQVVGTWRRTRPTDDLAAHRVDLADGDAVHDLVGRVAPDVVVHTAYDRDRLGPDVVDASAHVAAAAASTGAGMLHLSSDVVFSGEDPPYAEDTPPSPISTYGRAKAAAEVEVGLAVPDAAVVRTTLLLTPETLEPRTRWIADGVLAGRPVDLFADEIRQPVHRDDVADALWRLVTQPRAARAGIWHLVGSDALSRLDLGRLVCAAVGGDAGLLRGVPSPRDAPDPRPRDVRLTCRRAQRELGWAPRSVIPLYRARLGGT